MRLSKLMVLFIVCSLCACNPFATGKKSEHPENKPHHKLEDSEYQKLRKQQDSLLEIPQKKPEPIGMDTLKPWQA